MSFCQLGREGRSACLGVCVGVAFAFITRGGAEGSFPKVITSPWYILPLLFRHDYVAYQSVFTHSDGSARSLFAGGGDGEHEEEEDGDGDFPQP